VLNFATGSVQTLTTNGPITLGFSNLPAAGVSGTIALQVTVASTAHTITFPTAVSVNTAGIQGFDITTNVMEFAASGTYNFAFTTVNGGSTVTISQDNNSLVPFNNSSELLSSASAANLAVTTSYFTTVSASTATLAAGVAGQIKVFSMNAASGNMVITVTNHAWAGSGTITFSSAGQSCILQYTNNKWFCIGNNGATFS